MMSGMEFWNRSIDEQKERAIWNKAKAIIQVVPDGPEAHETWHECKELALDIMEILRPDPEGK